MSPRARKKEKERPEKLFALLLLIMRKLREPGGCPWDRKQTHHSIKRYVLEEAYEAFEAVSRKDWQGLAGELGDLLFQVVFHARMAEEAGRFTMADVLATVNEKLTSRHPHVFGTATVRDAREQTLRWDELKSREASGSLLDRVPTHMPALLQAVLLQERAHRQGFRWNRLSQVKEKLKEEIAEWMEAARRGNKRQMEEELGDLLFMIANLARWLRLDPEEALLKTNRKFRERFRYLESAAGKEKRALKDFALRELDALWRKAKKELRRG